MSAPQPRPPRRNFAQIHSRPLPLTTYPLPAFAPHNPFSLLQLAYAIITSYIAPPTSHQTVYSAYYSAATRSVHVTDALAVRALWENGFFGKGSLSRSEPEWVERQRQRDREREETKMQDKSENGHAVRTAGEVTRKRREERKREKRERARKEAEELEEQLKKEGKAVSVDYEKVEIAARGAQKPAYAAEQELAQDAQSESPQVGDLSKTKAADVEAGAAAPKQHKNSTPEPTTGATVTNQEHLQLTQYEAFFLSYGLGCLTVYPNISNQSQCTNSPYTNHNLLRFFLRNPTPHRELPTPDDPFLINYVVYHHFRSLGWVVRSGVKFAVDFLLYARGPVFSHAEFAVLVLPSYAHEHWQGRDASGRLLRKRMAREEKEWWWLHAANRVQNQVRKSLVLVWVEVPPPFEGGLSAVDEADEVGLKTMLKHYRVKEFIVSRWTANRQR